MRTEHGKIVGDLHLTDDLKLHGMVTGETVVASGGLLLLHGTCCRNVFVETGGQAEIHGAVAGSVCNRGGQVTVYGTVAKDVVTDDGQTRVEETAQVRGCVSRRSG